MSDISEPLNIRDADPRDVDLIVAMSTGHIANKDRFITESFARRSVVGAYERGRIVGYLIWDRTFFGRPFVWLLGVDPHCRRRGIATRLLNAFGEGCSHEGRFTSTNESNSAMHRVLARAGFVRSGCVENIDPGDPEVFYYQAPSRAGDVTRATEQSPRSIDHVH